MQDSLDAVVEMKEHDVPYHIRFCIDEGVRCGHWFNVSAKVSPLHCCPDGSHAELLAAQNGSHLHLDLFALLCAMTPGTNVAKSCGHDYKGAA